MGSLEWGGVRKLPHGLRFSCVGAGAGWGVLSSVSKATQLFREQFRVFAPEFHWFLAHKGRAVPVGANETSVAMPQH